MKYICVGESNHDGDFGYAANVALEAILTHKGVDCTIFDKFIGEFNVGDTTFVLCHGKDNRLYTVHGTLAFIHIYTS